MIVEDHAIMTLQAALHAPDGLAAVRPEEAGKLPAWGLSDLYPSIDSPALQADLDAAEAQATRFAETYAGKLDSLPGGALAAAIAEYQAIEETLGRVMSYAQLQFSGDGTDATIGRFM